MSKIYNTIGSLTTLKNKLIESNLSEFKSIKEVSDFKSSYDYNKKQIIIKHEKIIHEEKLNLTNELNKLNIDIENTRLETTKKISQEIDHLRYKIKHLNANQSKNIFANTFNKIKIRTLNKKVVLKENNFNSDVLNSISTLKKNQAIKQTRYDFICNDFNKAVELNANKEIFDLDYKISVINNCEPYIYGAIGEQKVNKTISKLSDDYHLINDFNISFKKAIYYKDEYIKSIQIDHILISPSGIFLIETKNWSRNSLQNQDLRSPIEQIKRSNFILFKLLNNDGNNLFVDKHHWGKQKIAIRNLLVFINNKPKEEFPFIKITTLDELNNYITYFKPTYSANEIKHLCSYLLKLNMQKNISI